MPELMIAMLLGLVIMGAAASMLSSMSAASKEQRVQAALAQDAQSALAMIATQMRMSGYKKVPGVVETNLFGCDTAFENPRLTDIDELRCSSVRSSSSAIAVRYEVDEFNADLDSSGLPVDCNGRTIVGGAASTSGAPSTLLLESRFFIRESATTKNPALYCAGNGGPLGSTFIAQSMIDNVDALKVTFGRDGIEMKSAADVDSGPGDRSDKWGKVRDARVCLQLRSDSGVTSSRTAFVDCEGKLVVPAVGDTRLRRSFTQTVQLRNQVDR